MTLRRFPWKIPRLTDNSFKLFAAEPTPGHDPKKLILPISKSTNALSDLPARDADFDSAHREKAAKLEPGDGKPPPSQATQGDGKGDGKGDGNNNNNNTNTNTGEKKEIIRGPWRILRLLPRESRHIIGRMLEIDPRKRAKMDEILDDVWVSNTVICRQVEPSLVVTADDHGHILEPPAQK